MPTDPSSFSCPSIFLVSMILEVAMPRFSVTWTNGLKTFRALDPEGTMMLEKIRAIVVGLPGRAAAPDIVERAIATDAMTTEEVAHFIVVEFMSGPAEGQGPNVMALGELIRRALDAALAAGAAKAEKGRATRRRAARLGQAVNLRSVPPDVA